MLNGVQQTVGANQKGLREYDIAIELIKAHVLNRLADAAASFAQMMVDSGTGLKEFESAMFGMLLLVGLQLLKKFGQMQTVTSLRSFLSTQASVSLSMPNS